MSQYIRPIGVNLDEKLYTKVGRRLRKDKVNLSAVVRSLLADWASGKTETEAAKKPRAYSRTLTHTRTKKRRAA